jgi:hypothetical protein
VSCFLAKAIGFEKLDLVLSVGKITKPNQLGLLQRCRG